jgi:hypothetical protein
MTPYETYFLARLQTFDPAGPFSNILVAETSLELARLQFTPMKPSRFTSFFLWDNIEWAEEYYSFHPERSLYKVYPSIAIPEDSLHKGEYGLVSHYPRTFRELLNHAKAYWTIPPEGKYEILCPTNLTILNVVEKADLSLPRSS